MGDESKRDAMLNKVRGLLEKAAGTDNEHEADAFYAAADRLMTQYAIEEFEIRDLAEGQQTVKAVHRRWRLTTVGQGHIAGAVADLMGSVANHCRCRIVYYGLSRPEHGVQVECLGLQTDVDWAEMLFTNLQVHLLSNISPHVVPGEADVEFIIRAKHAGMKWEQIALKLGWIKHISEFTKPIGLRMYGQYRKACAERGIEQVKANPTNWQYNFAAAYASRIWTRLYEIKRLNEAETRGHELVLVSMKQAVDDLWDDMFSDAKWSKTNLTERKRNATASLAGSKAADAADLGHKRVGGSNKQIGE